MRKWIGLCLMLALLAVCVMPALAAPARYTVTDLGILPDKISTSVYGNHSINNAGDVVGHCNLGSLADGLYWDFFTGDVAFIWTQQKGIQALPTPSGADNASAYTLNDRSQIIGIAGSSLLDARLVLWEKGTIRTFEPLAGDTATYPQAINNHGQIVGLSVLFDGSAVLRDRPVLWDSGRVYPLPTAGFAGGQSNDINEKGQIAGYVFTGVSADFSHTVPVLWDKRGSITFLGSLGGDFGYAWDINDKGQIVGQAQVATGESHAFFWQDGVITDLGTLGGGYASLWAVNNKGQAAGDSTTASGEGHAVLAEKGVLYDLNDFIPADSGWILLAADGINERGEISGTGLYNGDVRGFKLTPAYGPVK